MKKTKKLIIFGNTNYAEMVCDYFEGYSEYEVVCFAVNNSYKQSEVFYNKELVDFEDIEKKYSPNAYEMFIAIGSSNLNKNREIIYKQAIEKGYNLATFIHPDAYISDKVSIGKNCIIMECARILRKTIIGDNVIIWPSAFISHDNIIKNNCYIVGATNGFCEIGENCFLGAGSMIADKVKIAPNNFITMLAAVRTNTEEDSIYEGIPAKKRQGISATFFAKRLK